MARSESNNKRSNEQGPEKDGNSNVIPVDIVSEMQEAYLDYSMSVIVTRSLPDVRDGLKPVNRRILYSMHELGLTAGGKFRKSATVVGDVLGKYHPHGDSACYESMVRMAQDFSMRYPLVQGQGNFGSIDGDSAAAMRYTESKMSRLSSELLRDIEKETVDFSPNYDGSRKEPTVLPSVVPNLLLNGTLGIAVGMATKIPPHNITEVMNALIYLAENSDATTEDLFQFITGPDFPTGAMVFNQEDIHHAYATGRGGVVTRGEAEVMEKKGGGHQIIITSIPYLVNKAEMIVKMANLVRDKKIEGVKDIRDESTKDLRVVIDLTSTAAPQSVLNSLYKHTDLETTFHFNTLALVDGVPKLLSLKGILEEFLGHRREVVTRRTKYDLRRAEERAHILEGLKKALDHIDEVIKVIKKSKDTPEAHRQLMKKFSLSEIQATAILEMRLQKLAGLERRKIEDELKEKLALIKELKAILKDPKKVTGIIKEEFENILKTYGDERRTTVVPQGLKDFRPEDFVPKKENILIITAGGYIKRTDPTEYRTQRRGGQGVVDLNVKEEDFVTIFLTANTHSDLLFFTDQGKVYRLKMYEVPEGKRATRGKSLMNFLALDPSEKVTSVLSFPKEVSESDLSLLMVTRGGVAKKVSAASFRDVRRNGLIAMRLAEKDELLAVCPVRQSDSAVLVTKNGLAIHFSNTDIREMGRGAAGVRAIKLSSKDSVVGAATVEAEKIEESKLLIISEKGYGKKTPLLDYKIQKRGGSGIKTSQVTEKTGPIIASRVLVDEKELVIISKQGQVMRTGLDEISTSGRATQGVRVMTLKPKDSIASLVCL